MPRPPLSIRNASRLLWILVSLLVVLAVISGVFAWRDYVDSRRHLGEEFRDGAAAAARNLDRFLHERFELLSAVASSPQFRAADAAAIDLQLDGINAPARGFSGGLMWADIEGVTRARSASRPSVPPAEFVEAVLKSRIPSVTSVLAGDGRPMEAIAVPTTDEAGRLNGVLMGLMDLDAIRNLVPGLNLQRSQVSIVDTDEQIIQGGSLVRFTPVFDRFSYLAMRWQRIGWASGVADPRGRRDQILGYAIVPSSRWLVTIARPRTEALAPERAALRTQLALLALLIAGGLSVGIFEARRLSRAEHEEQQRRMRAARMRIAAGRFISAGERGTVGHIVADAVRDELATPWCAIVAPQEGGGVHRIASSGEVPERVDELTVAANDLTPPRADGSVRLTALVPDEEVFGIPIGDDKLAILPLASGRTLSEPERASVSAIVESAIQAFDRARLIDRDLLTQRRQEAVGAIEGELHAAEGVVARARRLVELIVPALADFALVEVEGRPGHVAVAARHRIPGLLPAVTALRAANLVAATPAGALVTAADGADFGSGDLAPLAGCHCVVAPVRAEGPPTTLIVGRSPDGRPFDESDRALVDALAFRAGVAITRARRGEQERQVALELQRSLLRHPPARLGESVRIGSRYRPGARDLHVGGDWFDAFELPDGRVALCVGDVVGHGLAAAAAMGRLASALRAIALVTPEPRDVLCHLEAFAARTEGARLATVAYVVLDPRDGTVTYRVAGHPPPLVIDARSEPRYLWEGRGAPLGVAGVGDHPDGATRIEAGDTILVFSDGLFERRGEPVDASLDRFAQLASRLVGHDPSRSVEAILRASLGERRQSDDVAIVAALVDRVGRHARFTFPARAANVGEARQAVRRFLETTQLAPSRAHDALLAVSEALANAVEHGSSSTEDTVSVELFESVGGESTVRVGDRGVWRDGHADGSRGRGMAIMQRLVDKLEVETTEAGTTVTLRITAETGSGS